MSALRQPDLPSKYYASKSQSKRVNDRHQKTIRQSEVKSTKIAKQRALASSNVPKNIKLLSLLQKGSFGFAVASMSASIGLYIYTVQIPKLWSQEYQHLEDLQRQERQLIAINETLKYQIAREAAQGDRLSISEPESAMFVTPAKIGARNQPDPVNNQQELVELKHNNLGY